MSLASLFAANGTTGAQVAARLENAFGPVDSAIFDRIDQGRQGMPRAFIEAVSIVLGVERADVVSEVSRIVVTDNVLARTPLPPIIGDSFRSTQLVPNVLRYAESPPLPLSMIDLTLTLGTIELLLLSEEGITTAAGPVVTAWADQSELERDFAHVTMGEQPDHEVDNPDFAGRDVLYFDGDDRLMSTDTPSVWKFLHDGTGMTVLLVYRTEVTGTGFLFDTFRGNPVSAIGMSISYNTTAGAQLAVGDASGTPVTIIDGGAHPVDTNMVISARYSTAAASLRVNGVEVATDGATGPSSSDPTYELAIGALARFGALGITGRMPAVVAYSNYMTIGNLAAAEEALAAHYGVTL